MVFGCRLLLEPHDDQPSIGLDSPITDEPESWSLQVSVPYLSPSLPSSPVDVQNSESPDASSSSYTSDSSSYFGSPIAERSRIPVQGTSADHIARPDNAEPFPVSPTRDSSNPASHVSSADLLPTFSVTGPPNPPPALFIPKRGPLAAIVRSESLPDSPITGVVDLTQQIKTLSRQAFAHGGFADIHWGEWERRLENGKIETTRVVIKLLRTLTRQDVDGVRARKRLNREVYVWHRLDHPNIARMFGTSYHMGERPALVLEWYQNGSASEYLRKNPSADRKMLVLDIARGLKYLHHDLNPPIVHGDLKGNNVLITRAGHAVLTDFGLSQVIEDLTGPSGNTTSSIPGTIRWQAPELVLDDGSSQKLQLTFSSDVWSFGCTAYELLTSKLPYYNRHRDYSVIQDIVHGIKPGEPDPSLTYAPGPQDKIWQLLDRCWSISPQMRPRMNEIDSELAHMKIGR